VSTSLRRQTEILALAREIGRVGVDDLATRFTVTPQTIRRDLADLCGQRALTRVHGGAIVASGAQNLAYEARRLVSQPHKRLIGEAAARLITPNSSLFITIGTTTEEVARALGGHALGGHAGLLVITNNLHVATELHGQRGIEVVVAGGVVRRADGGIVGAATVDMLSGFRVDTAVIGTSAIDADGTLLDFDLREVRVMRAVIGHARRVMLVSDSSKFARSAPVQVAHLSEVDVLVTDRLDDPAAELCRLHGVEVIEAGGPMEPDE
jgi:DeoR family transcriptional regulator, glycerol-3-phosphate regulon repressor